MPRPNGKTILTNSGRSYSTTLPLPRFALSHPTPYSPLTRRHGHTCWRSRQNTKVGLILYVAQHACLPEPHNSESTLPSSTRQSSPKRRQRRQERPVGSQHTARDRRSSQPQGSHLYRAHQDRATRKRAEGKGEEGIQEAVRIDWIRTCKIRREQQQAVLIETNATSIFSIFESACLCAVFCLIDEMEKKVTLSDRRCPRINTGWVIAK